MGIYEDIDEALANKKHNEVLAIFDALNVPGDTPFFTTAIAGLQYYDIDDVALSGDVSPKACERLLLVREPENRYDPNAIEVRNFNGEYQLGHLPRHIAQLCAPVLDELGDISAAVYRQYDGSTWSLIAVVYGNAIPAKLRNTDWVLAAVRAEEYDWLLAKRESMLRFENERLKMRKSQREQIARAFCSDEIRNATDPQHILSEIVGGDFVKRKANKGICYDWWDEVPDNLNTKTRWNDLGFKPKKGAKPYARIAYYARKKLNSYELFHVRDVEPKKQTPKRVAMLERQAMRRLLWDNLELEDFL